MNCEFMLNRCFTTGNRSYLPSISDFDAIIMNQRSIDFGDLPKKSQRNHKQYYIMYAFESPDYALMDVHKLDNYFNLTMVVFSWNLYKLGYKPHDLL